MLRKSLYASLGLGLVFLALPAQATTCIKTDNCWTSATELQPFNGTPTVLCIIGHPVVRIESWAECNSKLAGPSVTLKCGVQSDSISYSGAHGTTHTISTSSNWETVMGGACGDLSYDVTN